MESSDTNPVLVALKGGKSEPTDDDFAQAVYDALRVLNNAVYAAERRGLRVDISQVPTVHNPNGCAAPLLDAVVLKAMPWNP